jgi:hypothetical protein
MACATGPQFRARELAQFLRDGNYAEIAPLEAALGERLEIAEPAVAKGSWQKYVPIESSRVEFVKVIQAPPIDNSNGIVMVRRGDRLLIQFSSRDCLPLPALESRLGAKAKQEMYSAHVLDHSSGHFQDMLGPLELTMLIKTEKEPLFSSQFMIHVSTFLHLQFRVDGEAKCIRNLDADLTSRIG